MVLLRKGEAEGVIETFRGKFNMNFIKIDAHERFLDKLKGFLIQKRNVKLSAMNSFMYLMMKQQNLTGLTS